MAPFLICLKYSVVCWLFLCFGIRRLRLPFTCFDLVFSLLPARASSDLSGASGGRAWRGVSRVSFGSTRRPSVPLLFFLVFVLKSAINGERRGSPSLARHKNAL